jgi:hypothetical protein
MTLQMHISNKIETYETAASTILLFVFPVLNTSLHFRNRTDRLLRQVQPLLCPVGMPHLVLPLDRVETHYLYPVPRVHAEAEELHSAADIIRGVGQIRSTLNRRFDDSTRL